MSAVAGVALLVATSGFAAETTTRFTGKEVDRGTVTHEVKNGQHILTMSADFKLPGTPDPHWRVVDSKARSICWTASSSTRTRSIAPSACPSTSRTSPRSRCGVAWAEVLLGEGAFGSPIAMK
jgi:hypothetical protein